MVEMVVSMGVVRKGMKRATRRDWLDVIEREMRGEMGMAMEMRTGTGKEKERGGRGRP